MNSSEKRIELSRWAGSNDGWNASLPLRKDWPVDSIVVDLSVVSFVVPTFLLRLRAFIDFNLGCGRRVEVGAPRNRHVANYLSRMQISAGLPSEVFPDLPSVRTSEQGDVLVPITCLKSDIDVEEMGARLYTLFQGHSEEDVAVFADALQEGFTELCGNGVEHGQNDLGCYLAAQRYRGGNRRTVLSIGDLGIGVPEHMRRIYGDESDRRMLRKALEEGATGTGDSHRGNGIPSVIEEARNAQIRHALLEIHSGRAVLKHRLRRDGSSKTATEVASNKLGTWICLELGPLD
jgi:hypothetical protein